jgi:hypothetical protein
MPVAVPTSATEVTELSRFWLPMTHLLTWTAFDEWRLRSTLAPREQWPYTRVRRHEPSPWLIHEGLQKQHPGGDQCEKQCNAHHVQGPQSFVSARHDLPIAELWWRWGNKTSGRSIGGPVGGPTAAANNVSSSATGRSAVSERSARLSREQRACSSVIEAVVIACPSIAESNWKSIAYTPSPHPRRSAG